MKKSLFLTLLLALFCTVTTWAQFAPTEGKRYALQETTSGLYLDIQTLGINEANAGGTTNNLSLNAKPCIIYFAAGTTDASKWTMKNVNGTYAMQASSRNWNVTIGTNAYEWTINEPEASIYTIARADGKFINVDTKAAGQPLFCDKGTGMTLKLIEYSELCEQFTYTLKSNNPDNYLSFIKVSDTEASFQETGTEFYIKTSAGQYVFLEDKDNEGKYIGSTHSWNATTEFSLWKIGEADDEGYVYLTRSNDDDQYLGNTIKSVVGTGVFTNVPLSNDDGYCNRWLIEGTTNCSTSAITQNNKQCFESGRFVYEGVCNKLLFTLTESGAYYKNGAKRLSFDSFVLYDADGEPVSLATQNITGNNISDFSGMLDGKDGTYSNATWDLSSATDDSFVITLNEDLGGAFSFSFVTENTTMDAKAFKIVTSYEPPADYTFTMSNAPDGAVVTFDGNPIASNDKIPYVVFDEDLLVATDMPGYTWSVAVDKANLTITLTYTEAPVVENPAAVVALINRIGGAGTDASFKFVHDPSINSKNEVFVIGSEEGKVLIKGTTISAITTGIGWYLQNYAHINIAWNSLNEKTVSGDAYADLSSLPIPTGEETRTSDAMYRYYLNTCAFGYSMTSWTWKRWQQEIDWMALHGINMPLQLVGMEEVWRKFLTMEENGTRKYGYTDEEAKAFVAGPAFIAWWAMNNLEGWGGTAAGTKSGGTWEGAGGVQDDAWYARQKTLANQIVTRQRELGMQPVIPGWSGMVPTNFASKSGYTTRGNGGNWAGDFVRPLLLSVSNANYAEIAADYYTCLHEVMGESQYYSMDPFHEGGGAGTMEDYEALYAAMEAAMPGSKWVIQQWQWSPTQKYSLTAVPAGRLVVLDLFSDGSPEFDSYSGYAPQDAVFCAIPNFGGRSGIMGRLTNLANNYFTYKAKYSSIKGVGAAPEAIEQTPVTYDLIFQLPWMGSQPDVAEWVSNYSIARYGVANAEIQEAWSLLRQGPLNYGADGIQGPVEDVWAAKPNLTANAASAWGKTMNNAIGTYTKARHQMLIDATYKLISQSSAIAQGTIYESNYNYDLVEFGGGVLADYAYYLLLGINEAKTASNTALYEARRDAFLQLILDVDAFKGTNLNFRLGKWTQEARDAAGEVEGATTATPDWYEYNNARTIVSTWSTPATNLNDYSYRSWQGLMKDLYYPRWKYYFDNDCTAGNYDYFAWNWAHGKEHYVGQTAVSNVALTAGQPGHTDTYTREPEGNTLEKAKEVLGKYIIPVVSNTGTYYAYRCLTNDLSAVCTVVADAGQTIDLSTYFGELTNVSITGDFIDGTATDIKAVTVKADATDGSHTGTITLADGTVLTFAVVLNPSYYGVYKLALKSFNNGSVQTLTTPAEMFVQYNTTVESGSSNGYKLIAKDVFSANDEADKYFIITPQGAGYSLSAQGLYLKQPDVGTWNHINFSDKKSDAGTYLITETETDIFKIASTASGYNHMNAYDNKVMGNDASTKYSTFTITEVTTYPVTIPANGLAINLPFNVVLPDGVTAYDVVTVGDNENSEKVYETISLATAGGVVKAGTPMILKAAAGDYTLGVTVDNTGAVGSKAGSVLRGNFIKQTLAVNNAINRYTFADDATFNLMTTATELAGNSVYMELSEAIDTPIAEGTTDKPQECPELDEAIENLDALLEQFDLVINSGDVVEGKITLQSTTEGTAGYIWTNAQEDSEGPIADLIDGDPGSHFHTEYGNTTTAEGYHYIEIYLGEDNTSTAYKFLYYTRDDAQGGYPQSITVLGSNDKQNYTPVYTVSSGLPQSKGVSYTSSSFETGEAYKYLRFKVETPAVFWHMGEFELYNVKVELPNATDYTNLRNITNDEVVAAYNALQAAIETKAGDSYDEKVAAAENLVTIYEALLQKMQYSLDEGVYNINFGGNPIFIGYATAEGSNLTGDAAGYHLYDATDANSTAAVDASVTADALFTITRNGAGYSLSAQGMYLKSTAIGTWSVQFFSENEDQAGVYMFEETETDIYKLKSSQASHQYVNDWGAYFGNDLSTKGGLSTFTLTKVTEYTVSVPASGITTLYLPFNVVLPEGVTAYTIDADDIRATQDGGYCYEKLTEVAVTGDILAKGTAVIIKAAEGNHVFDITLDNTDAKTVAQTAALKGTYFSKSVSAGYSADIENDEVVFTGFTVETIIPSNTCWLETAFVTDKIGLKQETVTAEIEDGKVYRIHGRLSNGVLRTLYNNGANKKILWTGEAKSDASTLFIAQKNEETGKFKLVSAVANGYWSQEAKIEEEGVELTFVEGFADGTYMILGNNERRFCADGNDLDFYSNAAGESAGAYVNENVTTDFVFELVEDVTVSYTVRINKNLAYATLYLPYAVTVPDGVTAYIAHTVEGKVIQLTDLQDVIPAKTPVVLKRESVLTADDYVFEYTTDETEVNLTGVNNVLTGYFIETLVEGRDGFRYYMLMKYNTSEKFFWILKEYDSTGKLYTDGEDHTHIKCLGNKAFLEMSESQASSSFSFQFTGTTGIDGVDAEGGNAESIYDLQGRKLSEITEKGVYIINGEKVIK